MCLVCLVGQLIDAGRDVAAGRPNADCETGGGGDDDDAAPCDAQQAMLGKMWNLGRTTVPTVGDVARAALAVAADEGDGGLDVAYARGAEIEAAATNASEADAMLRAAVALAAGTGTSAVVMVLGDSKKSCAEWGDRSTLDLPGNTP